MTKLIFFHGLNTFGDDDLHLGPLRLGPMHSRLSRALELRGQSLLAIRGLGAGSPEEQAERALAQILAFKDETFCLLGHSVGGLVARAAAHRRELSGRIRNVITFGTPHHGAYVAELGMTFGDRNRRLNRALAIAGYHTGPRKQIYAQFTPDRLRGFNESHPVPSGVSHFSLICEATGHQLGWPLRLTYRHLHPAENPARIQRSSQPRPSSDGFIWSSSQRFGECLGPFALDHFAQIGYFFQVSQVQRVEAEKEFRRMLELILGLTELSKGASR